MFLASGNNDRSRGPAHSPAAIKLRQFGLVGVHWCSGELGGECSTMHDDWLHCCIGLVGLVMRFGGGRPYMCDGVIYCACLS